jgi:hypothetical protein
VVAQPPHEPACRGIEAALVQTDKADDVALWGLGSLSDANGTIHAGCGLSSAGVSCPPFTNTSSDSWVTSTEAMRKGPTPELEEPWKTRMGSKMAVGAKKARADPEWRSVRLGRRCVVGGGGECE